MLFPQFSLRRLLAVVTASSLVFLALSLSVRGRVWAGAVSIGVLMLALVLLLHGFVFFLVWLFASATSRRKRAADVMKTTAMIVALAWAATTHAGGAVYTLPANGKPAPNGMVLSIDTTWVDGYGYRPVTLSVKCTPPTPADRTLQIEIRYHDWNPNNTLLTVTTELDVPGSATTASTTVAVPNFLGWQSYSIDVWEDGRHIPALSAKGVNLGSGWMTNTNGMRPTILFVAAPGIDVSQISGLFPQQQYAYQYGNSATTGPLGMPNDWATVPAINLPDHWLCYQSVDVIVLSLADATHIATISPKVWDAICEWTLAGGSLWVHGAGGDWHGTAEIDKLLKLTPQLTAESAALPPTGWRSPEKNAYRGGTIDVPNTDYNSASQVQEVDENGNVVLQQLSDAPADGPFRWRDAGFGTILAIGPDDPFAQTFGASNWSWMFNSIGNTRWFSAKRIGGSFTEQNDDFWTFVNPGVGGAPVDAYRILITLFVVLIGPVNYLTLRKHGRLHLLLFTVPASALIVTAALLGFALISDGLHTRLRTRSITSLDQQNRRAVSWARQAYYAGLAPSAGLKFPDDTAVIPYEHQPSGAPGGRQISRAIDIGPSEQHLRNGWLQSRTPTQFITLRPRKSEQFLKVVVTKSSGDTTATAENGLGTLIHHLFVSDEQGGAWYAKDVSPRATAELAADAKGAAAMVREFDAARPKLPDDFRPNTEGRFFGFRRNWMIYSNNSPTIVSQFEGCLETGISECKSELTGVVSDDGSTKRTPQRFIAIVDRPKEINVGLEGARETDSFHVICGNW